ncbi:hypothetical protein IM284_02870, partial [Enterobacter cloacae complex sp. P12RS]|nr:hypothetical protein [Enterobacter cloacae complex sp. P12RS]
MNKLARLLLTASSIAPVCATLFFIGFVKETVWLMNYSLYVGLVSWLLAIGLIKYSEWKLEVLTKNINSLSPSNK